MKIVNVEQGSLEWLSARAGVVTASEADALVSPTFEIRTGQMPKTYLSQKVSERWVGGPIAGAMTMDMETGKILEEEAIPAYEFEFSEAVQRVGLITDDAGRIGCSPDGLIGDDGGIEIKCPLLQTHVKYLLAGEIPPEYAVQVQFSLYVTGRKFWRFMSYNRNLPPLVKLIEPDAKAQAAFSVVIPHFLERLDEGFKRLCEMNGGAPKRNEFREQVINQKPQQGIDLTP